MATPKRTESARLAVQAEGSRSPNPDIFYDVLELLQRLAERWGDAEATAHTLTPAARYLAGAITIYAKAVDAELPDSKRDREEMPRIRESQAAKLAALAQEMEAIMGHPACQYLLLNPADEIPLRALLQKLTQAHDNATPADEARARRDEARARLGMTARDGNGTPQGNRKRICHALAWAWEVATGQAVQKRKHNSEQEPYGEFLDFIRAALDLTKATRHMSPDEVHRDIEGMGE